MTPGAPPPRCHACAKRAKRPKRNATLGLLALAATVVPACRRGEPSPQTRETRDFIAVVGAGRTDPLWPALSATAARLRGRLGKYDLRIDAPPFVSVNAQLHLVRRLDREHAKALCIQVIDPPATRPLIESLRARGLAVVTMVRPVHAPDPFNHFGWSEQAIGKRMADALADALPAGGDVAVIVPSANGDDGLNQRRAMLRRGLADHANLRVVYECACAQPDAARRHIADAPRRFPTLSAWAAIAPWPITGTTGDVAELRAAPLIVTAHPLPPTWPAFDAGVNIIAVAPAYEQIAPAAVHAAYAALLSANTTPGRVDVPLRVIDLKSYASFRRDWAHWATAPTPPRNTPETPDP
ncbi:MAG: sugar ABC transporter substrate-binding protein [Phycisphaerae bacterium]